MRSQTLRLILAVFALSLGACSWLPKKSPETPTSSPVVQRGPLKVHPGLLGQPVPPELQVKEEPKLAAAEAAPATPAAPAKPADADLLAKRAVYFDVKSAEIKAEDNAVLAAHGRRLAKNPETRVRVEGNADERGSDGLNKRLGQQRADAVKAVLTANGAGDQQVATVSYGRKKPKATGHDEESWAENRRADLIYDREQ